MGGGGQVAPLAAEAVSQTGAGAVSLRSEGRVAWTGWT